MQQETEREGECAGFIERDSARARMRENVYVCSCEREIEINCERKELERSVCERESYMCGARFPSPFHRAL